MELIDKIVFNELASKQPVSLPGIGTLWVEYRPAQMKHDNLQSPYNEVCFSEKENSGAPTAIDIIEAQNIDRTTAEKIYNSWFINAKSGDYVKIDNVGFIENGIFSMTGQLSYVLNPVGQEQIVSAVGKKSLSRNEKIWLTLIIAFILILAGGWGLWYKNNGRITNPTQTQTSYVYTTAQNPENANEQVATEAEQELETANENPIDTENNTTHITDNEKTEQIEATGVTASTTPPKTIYYVVGGIFSVPENADKYIRETKTKFPDSNLEYDKLPYKGKTMVTIYSSANSGESEQNKTRLSKELKASDLWVYKATN